MFIFLQNVWQCRTKQKTGQHCLCYLSFAVVTYLWLMFLLLFYQQISRVVSKMSMMRDRVLDLAIMQYLMIWRMFAVLNHQLQSLLSSEGWDRVPQEITCRVIDGLKFLQFTKKHVHIMEKFELNDVCVLSLRLTNTRDNGWRSINILVILNL